VRGSPFTFVLFLTSLSVERSRSNGGSRRVGGIAAQQNLDDASIFIRYEPARQKVISEGNAGCARTGAAVKFSACPRATSPTRTCCCRTRCKSGCQGHLAHYISDTVDALELSAFYERYEGGGPRNQPFHPAMMVKVLLYGQACGVLSSRKMVRKLHEDVAFRDDSRNDRSGGDRPDSRNGGDLLAQGGLFHKRLDPAICDDYLFLECVQLLEQHPNQRLAETCEFTFALFKDVGHGTLESCWRLGNRDSALAEQSSDLVDECHALVDQQLTNTMHSLYVLLFNRLRTYP
jgi:hypothetical protein